jgi:hypothetical protein
VQRAEHGVPRKRGVRLDVVQHFFRLPNPRLQRGRGVFGKDALEIGKKGDGIEGVVHNKLQCTVYNVQITLIKVV